MRREGYRHLPPPERRIGLDFLLSIFGILIVRLLGNRSAAIEVIEGMIEGLEILPVQGCEECIPPGGGASLGLGGSGAPDSVVAGQALIEVIAARGRMAPLIPG